MNITIVAISDTHGQFGSFSIPDGDILIHAGDITLFGSLEEVELFNQFIKSLPHPDKIIIAGNHDFCFEKTPRKAAELLTHCHYLCDQSITVKGLNIYGSPWSPWFFNWAFNLHRGKEIREKWILIPEDTDILITHGPPFGILDRNLMDQHVGCADLLERVKQIKPQLHIFGHIHEAYGMTKENHLMKNDNRGSTNVEHHLNKTTIGAQQNVEHHTIFMNASICTFNINPVNPPLVYTLNVE